MRDSFLLKLLLVLGFVAVVSLPFLLVEDKNGELDGSRVKKNVLTKATHLKNSANEIKREVGSVKEEAINQSTKLAQRYSKPFKNSPGLNTYQKEVAINPHIFPDSLRKFALNLTDEMKEAKNSMTEGVALFEKLATCARAGEKEEILVVRAVCAENAKTLAELYPTSLNQKFKKLSSELDQKVKLMVNH